MKPDAIIFDFDGVILDSVEVKTRAFGELVKSHGPVAVEKMLAYHQANGGVSRYLKFEWFYREVLKNELSTAQSEALGRRFEELAFDGVMSAPFIPGAREFLENHTGQYPFFVASGTPHEELAKILDARQLVSLIVEAWGTPKKKPDIIQDILDRYSFQPDQVLFVGDAMTDYRAALETGLRFVGVGSAPNAFPPGATVIPDLSTLQGCIKGL